jgi:hypothetical protein
VDADGDGTNDNIEGWDTDGDGIAEVVAAGSDIDGDGLDDSYDNDDLSSNPTNGQTPASFPDVINVGGEPDWRQLPIPDADGDGISDDD